MADELVTPTGAELIEFGTFRNPEDVLKTAETVARSFKKRADQLQLYKQIGPSKHLLIEGWQTLAAMYRVSAGVVSDRYVEFGASEGFEATAEAIYVPTGARISTAHAMCLSDEENWGFRPKYEQRDGQRQKVADVRVPLQQLRSMAQTRACSKVLSNLLKWVARMAGYAGTPAEEMTGTESHEPQSNGQSSNGQASNGPQRKSGGTGTISEAQENRLYAIAKNAGKSKDALGVILAHFGFPDGSSTVTRDKYDAICAEILK